MDSPSREIAQHYTVGNLGDRILAALAAAGKDPDGLTQDDLAPVDEFHLRGRAATEELAEWAEIRSGHEVLDVGCGLGGTSRWLGATYGCDVVGVDLTAEFCHVAEMLSARVGLTPRTVFQQGSALALPFVDHRFDVVWTEHVQMNLADKAGFYGAIARVLKPGGQFAFHDIFGGTRSGLSFPVPWAERASISHLIGVPEVRSILAVAGFVPVRWEDKTEASAAFLRDVLARTRKHGWRPVGLHLVMGDDATVKLSNLLRNLEGDRARVVQAVMRRVAG